MQQRFDLMENVLYKYKNHTPTYLPTYIPTPSLPPSLPPTACYANTTIPTACYANTTINCLALFYMQDSASKDLHVYSNRVLVSYNLERP